MRRLLILFALLATAGASATEVYRWVDKDGRVHYGDQPKQGGEAVDVRTGSGSGVPSESEQARLNRDAECQKKKAQLDSYKKASSIKETDSLGRTKEYNEQERAQFLAQAEKSANEACAPPPQP